MITKYLSFLLLVLSFNSHSENEHTLVFNTFLIPLMVESETEGVFIELTRQIAQRAGLDIKINILPAKRSIHQFNLAQADVLFPALDPFFINQKTFNRSKEVIYIKRDFAFTLKDQSAPISIPQLEGRKVSITRGYPYAPQLINNPNIQFFTANSDMFSAKMLQAGHVDAFVAEEKSGLTAIHNIGLEEKVHYSQQYPISELDAFYATMATEQGLKLASILSEQLALMKKDGSFVAIMAKTKQ